MSSASLDFVKDELSSALETIESYTTSTPRLGRGASEEYWNEVKDAVAGLLLEDPDTLFHLIYTATTRLNGLISNSITYIDQLLEAVPLMPVVPKGYTSLELANVRKHIVAMKRVSRSEAGRRRRVTSLRREVQRVLFDHRDSSIVNGVPIKNRAEVLQESRSILEDLEDLHTRILIIPDAILGARTEHADPDLHETVLLRSLDKIDTGLQEADKLVRSSPDNANLSERQTTLQIASVSALVNAKSTYIDPMDAKASGGVLPQEPCVPAIIQATNQPPYAVGPTETQVVLDVDGDPETWDIPQATSAKFLTGPVSDEQPYMATPDVRAELVTDSHASGVNILRTVSTAGVGTVTITAINPAATAAGDPAQCVASGPSSLFSPLLIFPGDMLMVQTGVGTSGWQPYRILSISDDLNAVVELPSPATTGGPYTPGDTIIDNRMTISVDGGSPVTMTLSQDTIDAAKLSTWDASLSDITDDFNSFFPAAPSDHFVYNAGPSTITFRSGYSDARGSVSVVESPLQADKDVRSPLQYRLRFLNRDPGAKEIVVLSGVEGVFYPDESVDFGGGTYVTTVRGFIPGTNQMTIDDSSGSVVASQAVVGVSATGTVDNVHPPLDMTGRTDNRTLEFSLMTGGTLYTESIDITAGTYTDPATLAAVIDGLATSPVIVTPGTGDDESITFRTPGVGDLEWIRTGDGTANVPLALVDDLLSRGSSVPFSDLEVSVRTSLLPATLSTSRQDLGRILVQADGSDTLELLSPEDLLALDDGDRVELSAPGINVLVHNTSGANFITGQSITADTGATAKVSEVGDTYLRLQDMVGDWENAASIVSPSVNIVVAGGDLRGEGTYTLSNPTIGNVDVDQDVWVGVYEASFVRETISLASNDTSLSSALDVESGAAQARLGLPKEEARGTTNVIKIDGVTLERVVQSKVRVGDRITEHESGTQPVGGGMFQFLVQAFDLGIQSVMTSANTLKLSDYIDNNVDTNVDVLALGAYNYPDYQTALFRAWRSFKAGRFYTEDLTSIRKLLEQAFQSRRYEAPYRAILEAYRADLQSIADTLTYVANDIPAMRAILDGLQEQRMDAAYEILSSARITEFLSLDLNETTNFVKAIRALGEFGQSLPLPTDDDELGGLDEQGDSLGVDSPREDLSDPEEQPVDSHWEEGDDLEGVYG